jgi:hypothetical protein
MTPRRLPTATEITDWRRHAERLIDSIDDGTIALAVARAAIPSVPDGYPSSTLGDGGSRGSDATSSTERAAMAKPIPDPITSGVLAAVDQIRAAIDGVVWAMHGIKATLELGEVERGRQSVLVDCCEIHCEDVAVKAGRCRGCYEWHARAMAKGEDRPVPRDVIQQRVLRRDSTAG